MSFLLWIVLLAVGRDYPTFPFETLSGHSEQYSPGSELQMGAQDQLFDMSPEPLAIVVNYGGKLRSIPGPKKSFLSAYAKAIGNESFFKLYSQEMLVKEGAKEFWVPVQDALIPHIKEDLRTGKPFTAEVRYFGVTKAKLEPVYLLISFYPEITKRPPDPACFSTVLGGVELGERASGALERLEAKVGKPTGSMVQDGRKHFVLPWGEDKRASLILGTDDAAGNGTVSSIQISGEGTSSVKLEMGLSLGLSMAQVESALGSPWFKSTEDGAVPLWLYFSPACSIEFTEGKATSIRIGTN